MKRGEKEMLRTEPERERGGGGEHTTKSSNDEQYKNGESKTNVSQRMIVRERVRERERERRGEERRAGRLFPFFFCLV
jgi:hypothetical protein